ncbi:MAG: toll/interleukin-1 receptor domain-containing protein [Cyclobacteriaceae bacterium]
MNHTAKYDVAISFAEEQRDIAVSICLALEGLGLLVYYYPYHIEESLGKGLKLNLEHLYSTQSHIVIAILSGEYRAKTYTQIEFKSILNRTDKGSLIPVRFSTSEIPQEVGHLAYFQWANDPKPLAQAVKERLEKRSSVLLEGDPLVISKMSKSWIAKSIDRYKKLSTLSNAEFHFNLGLHYYYLNLTLDDLYNAEDHFKTAGKIDPFLHKAFYYQSKAFIKRKGLNQIRYAEIKYPCDSLSRALELDPGNENYASLALELDTKYFKKRGLRSLIKI